MNHPFFIRYILKIQRLVQQWLTLPINLGLHDTPEERVTTSILGAGEIDRLEEENGEDNNGKDPLQGNYLGGDLFDSQS